MKPFLLSCVTLSYLICLPCAAQPNTTNQSAPQPNSQSNSQVDSEINPQIKVEVYKLQLGSTGNDFSVVPFINTSRNEWVRITVSDRKVKLLHSTSISNPVGIRNWYDHPVTMIRMCLADSFETKNCKTIKGDTVDLPTGKSIYDVVIDFKFVESGSVVTRSFQISTDLRPEKY